MNEFDKYYSRLPASQKDTLKHIEKIIVKSIPDITLSMSYQMPCFYYKSHYLIGMAGFKDHMSIFPGSEPIEKLQQQLKSYKTTKGTIQFTEKHLLDDDLLKKIIQRSKERIDA